MLVAEHYGVEVLEKESSDAMERLTFDEGEEDDLEQRPPVVAIMGHVDHGKTTLLDRLRNSHVAEGEAGGITQSIGAYTIVAGEGEGGSEKSEVSIPSRKRITFIDTPGHEAFSAMRVRGAQVTDIVVLVVAADDGVKPQTKEALKQARAAEVPIIVAITKTDASGAQIERVKQELSQVNLLPEEWGGDTVIAPLSAKTGDGIDGLLDAILLLSDIHEYKSNPDVPAVGTILEANMDKTCGPVATCLVQAGTLRIGDIVTAGVGYGRVKSMVDASGGAPTSARPSFAVQMVGFNNVPSAGDTFKVVDDESDARAAAEKEMEKERQLRLSEQSSGSFMSMGGSSMSMDGSEFDLKILNVVLRASASGSLEALKACLQELPQEKVMLRYLLTSTGDFSQSDVDLAATSDACIIGFDVSPTEEVAAYAKQQSVKLVYSDIIYDVISQVESDMLELLDDEEELEEIGEGECLAVFGSNKSKVAGCKITEGMVKKGCRVQVSRKKRVMHEGALTSLRIVKDVVSEVEEGNECGLAVEGFEDWEPGDKLKFWSVLIKRPSLG